MDEIEPRTYTLRDYMMCRTLLAALDTGFEEALKWSIGGLRQATDETLPLEMPGRDPEERRTFTEWDSDPDLHASNP